MISSFLFSVAIFICGIRLGIYLVEKGYEDGK